MTLFTSALAAVNAGAADRVPSVAPTQVSDELGLQASFQDWLVGCDNTRTCRAIGLPADADIEGTALIVDRSGDP